METALLKNMVKKNRWFSSWLLAVKAIYKTGHHVTFVILSHLLCLLPKDTAPFSFASYSVYNQFVCVFSVSLTSVAFSSSPCISEFTARQHLFMFCCLKTRFFAIWLKRNEFYRTSYFSRDFLFLKTGYSSDFVRGQ